MSTAGSWRGVVRIGKSGPRAYTPTRSTSSTLEVQGDVGRCRGDVGEMWGYVGRSWEIYGASRCGRGDGENLRVIGGYLWHLELARLVVDGGAEHLVRVRARARARARVRARARARG